MVVDSTLTNLFKLDCGITTNAYDGLIVHIEEQAIAALTETGITLPDNPTAEDYGLVRMYATWLWRQRDEKDQPMPRMLQYSIHNRLFSQKAATEDA